MFILALLAGCGPQPAPDVPTVAPPRDAGRLAAASPVAMAAAGDTVFYADLEGVWAVPIAGGDARLVTNTRQLVQRIVPHGTDLYLAVEDGLLLVPTAGGTATAIHTAGAGLAFAVDDGGIWFNDGNGLQVMPLAGGAARTVAERLGSQASIIVTDADAVFVTEELSGEDRPSLTLDEDVVASALWRVAKVDGKRTPIARRQFGVAGVAVRDDRVYWTSYGAGLRSAPAAGGAIRTHVGGAGVALTADVDGVIVETASHLLIEVRGDVARVDPGALTRMPEATPAPVLAGGALVALVTDESAGASELWRLKRPWTSQVTVAGWVTDRVAELAVSGDDLLVLDAPRDETLEGRIVRIGPGGKQRVVARATGIDGLAVDGDTIGYHAAGALWRVGPGPAARAVALPEDELVLGLTLAGDRFYWSDSQTVRTAPASGGAASTLHEPRGRFGGSGRPDAELVVDGATVYFSSLGWGSTAVQRVKGLEATDLLFEPGEDAGHLGDGLVRAGDALYVTVGESEVWRVPMAGGPAMPLARELPTLPYNLVAVGQRLACAMVIDGTTTVAMIDPMKGSMTPLLGLPRDYTVVLAGAPSGDAVYVGLVASDLILRVPLPAR